MALRQLSLAFAALTIVTILSVTGPKAAVIYQVSPTGSLNTPAANSAGSRTAFDSFILTDAATVTSISWLGTGSLPTDTYRVGLYDSTSQDPGLARPEVNPFLEIVSTAGGTVNATDPGTRDYAVDLGAGAFLAADTAYWLSIRNVTTGRFFWLWKGDTFGSYISRDNNGTDFPAQLTLFFTLEGELGNGEPPLALAGPSAAALLALGMIAISTGRRSRNRHSRTSRNSSNHNKG